MKTKMTLTEWLPLIGMTIFAFLVNTSEFIPIGLLTDISKDFNLTTPTGKPMGFLLSSLACNRTSFSDFGIQV